MSKYLDKLKTEICLPDQLQKVQKATDTPSVPTAKSAKRPFYSFYSTDSGRFSENHKDAKMQQRSSDWRSFCDAHERTMPGSMCPLKRTRVYDPFKDCIGWQIKNRKGTIQ